MAKKQKGLGSKLDILPVKTGHSQSSSPLTRIAKNYALMMENGTILSNRAAIELIDQRIIQLAGRIDTDEAPERTKKLYGLWHELQGAVKRDRGNDVLMLTKAIDEEFEKAYHDYAAWNQMIEIFDLRRKHVDSEVKTVKEMKAMLTAEQGHRLVAKLLAVCIRLIKDPKLLRQINYEFSRIIGEDNLQQPVSVVDSEFDEEADEDD